MKEMNLSRSDSTIVKCLNGNHLGGNIVFCWREEQKKKTTGIPRANPQIWDEETTVWNIRAGKKKLLENEEMVLERLFD